MPVITIRFNAVRRFYHEWLTIWWMSKHLKDTSLDISQEVVKFIYAGNHLTLVSELLASRKVYKVPNSKNNNTLASLRLLGQTFFRLGYFLTELTLG